MKKSVFFTRQGIPKTGLAPSWTLLKKIETNTNFTPQPPFSDIGGGHYRFEIDSVDNLVGTIDGNPLGVGSDLSDTDRYKPFNFEVSDFQDQIESYAVTTYNEDSDALTFLVFATLNGRAIQSLLTSCTINVYDINHILLFTTTSTSQTNGVFILTKSNPTIVKNVPYYIEIEMTYDGVVYTSIDSYSALE